MVKAGKQGNTLVIAALFAAALVALVAFFSETTLLVEDGPVEMLSAGLYAIAAVVGLRKWSSDGRNDGLLLGVAAICLIAALDELSFGERLFGFQAPVVMGIKIDGLHDLLDLAKAAIVTLPGSPYLWTGLILLVIAPLALVVLRHLKSRGWTLPPASDCWPLGAAAVVLGVALLIDTGFRPVAQPFVYQLGLEEIFEATAGLILLLFVIKRPTSVTSDQRAAAPAGHRQAVPPLR